MFFCTQCYQSSDSASTSPCLHCGYFDAQTTVSDNFNPTEPEASSQFGTASGSQRNLLPNNMQMDELARTHDRTRNASKHRIELDNSSTNKKSRNEICAITLQALPTSNEQRAMDYDIAKETRSASQIAFDKSLSHGVYNEFQNNKELHPQYEDMEEFGKLNSNGQNRASNFRNFQSTQNENKPKEISDSFAPMREMIQFDDDSFAVPGPSGFHDNNNAFNLWIQELQSMYSLELQSAGVTQENSSEKKSNLHQHTDTIGDTEILRCNICEELIWEEEDHDNEKTCKFCKEKFQCKTLLEQHSLNHEEDYFSNCRVCGTDLFEHIHPVEKGFYKCCYCDLKCQFMCNLRTHLYTHTGLKLFKCDLCDKRFAQKGGLSNHIYTHFQCEICTEKFPNSEYLDAHRSDKH